MAGGTRVTTQVGHPKFQVADHPISRLFGAPHRSRAQSAAPAYPITVTFHSSGRPGTGVHGVGLHALGPAANGTSTMDDPTPIALRLALNMMPSAPLDIRTNTRPSEMVGGPGQDPPVIPKPPVSIRIEPTVTQTGVTASLGCASTLTVPLAHAEPGGLVDGSEVPIVVVTVTCDEPGGCVELADVDGEEHPDTNMLATTTIASRQVGTSST